MGLICRSLLAGDIEIEQTFAAAGVTHRLPLDKLWVLSRSNGQAGSYLSVAAKSEKLTKIGM